MLAVGISTRAVAESAADAGHRLVTVDYFGDRDQKNLAENHGLQRDFGLSWAPAAVAAVARELDYDALLYTSDLENHPALISAVAGDRLLLGNDEATVRRVRDWRVLRRVCREEGILHPTTLLPGEEGLVSLSRNWLTKPARGGGGHGIRPWDGQDLEEGRLLQEWVQGVPASAAFVADGRDAALLGLTEQLLGRPGLGVSGFGWCGNVYPLCGPPDRQKALEAEVQAMVSSLTRRFGLRGANGVDLVLIRGEEQREGADEQGGHGVGEPWHPWLVEVNPRYSASMELLERGLGESVFLRHLASCAGGLRPPGSQSCTGPDTRAFLAKGIVFSRGAARAPDTGEWLCRGRRDIPFPGEPIEAGRPVCTVMAGGDTRAECLRDLENQAEQVYAELGERTEDSRERRVSAHHRSHA